MASTPTPSPVTPTPATPAPTTPSAPPPTAPATPPPAAPAPPPASPPPVTPAAPPPSVPSPPAATPPPGAKAPPPSTTPDSPPPPEATPSTPGTPPSTTPDVPSPPSTTPSSPSNPSPSKPSPSTPKNSPPTQSSPVPAASNNGVSTSLVVGVAVGGLVVLLLLSLFCVCCWRKKKRSRKGEVGGPMHYGGPPPPLEYQGGLYKEDPYAPQYQYHPQNQNQYHHQNQNQSSQDHIIKFSSDPPPPHSSRPSQPPLLNSGGSNSTSGDPLPPPSPPFYGPSKSTFTYEELLIATDSFSDSNLLGQGGFGYVHKGILPNGKEIAVKQLKIGSGQGEREFQAEVEIISRVHHKHLVSLVGYCVSGGQRLLVYEFVPNNTLEYHLHGKGVPTMEWAIRIKIALGAAKGLAYLHEDCHPKIIHRDIKASNILLDYKFEAKVADFGLAKFTSENVTHVSTRVMGTFGYLAPEYASSGKLTDKSDVFSYGVMLLELITGRRPVDTTQSYMDDSLVDWARPLLLRALEEGNYENLVDKKLGNNLSPIEVARVIACAAACVRHSAKRRPRMSQVVRALEGDVSLEDLNKGEKPGHSRYFGSYSSSDYDSSHYNEDMKKFRKMAYQSNTNNTEGYVSSQYSAPTSEYGQNPSGSSSEGGIELKKGKESNNKDSYQFGSGGY